MTRSRHDQSVTLELISPQQEQALAEVAACATNFVSYPRRVNAPPLGQSPAPVKQ
jgi:hypothetical protein